MRVSTGRRVMVAGVVIGTTGVIAVSLGLLDRLPEYILKAAMIKLVLLGALGVIGMGATLVRFAKLEEQRRPVHIPEPAAAPVADKDQVIQP